LLSNGHVIVVSGHDIRDVSDGAVPDVNVFNHTNNSWTRVADLNHKRWYPTSITMPNGNILTVSGTDDMSGITHSLSSVGVSQTEVYNYRNNSWGNPTTNQITIKAKNSINYSYPVKDHEPSDRIIDGVKFFDKSGNAVMERSNLSGLSAFKIDVSFLKQYLYIIRIYCRGITEEHKIIVLH
jgi:hypothetical protein